MFVTLSEEEVSLNKKQHLSPEEEGFLCHLFTMDKCTPIQEQLREIANCMYGKKVKELKPKPGTIFMAGGEAVLSISAAVLFHICSRRWSICIFLFLRWLSI